MKVTPTMKCLFWIACFYLFGLGMANMLSQSMWILRVQTCNKCRVHFFGKNKSIFSVSGPEYCFEEPKPGPDCWANLKMWYWDEMDETCKEFIVRGCPENKNRFYSIKHCETICTPTFIEKQFPKLKPVKFLTKQYSGNED